MSAPSLADSGLKDAVAIVTGGSGGIGRAIVQVLAAAGMEVVFTYHRNAPAATEAAQQRSGGKISSESLDIRDAAACSALAEKVFERSGRIDLLVNNAGVIRDNPLTALEDADVRFVLETNVLGAFNMTRAVAPFMISKRRGKIVNISSVAGENGRAGPDELRGQQGRDKRVHALAGGRACTA